MRIDRARLEVTDLPDAGRFFSDVLALPVEHEADGLQVRAGRSRLILSEGRRRDGGVHHLAFDVPAGAFAAHRDWLAARAPLLAAADGTTEFEGPPGWNSRSVYVEGPDRMVLELIARRNRPGPATSGAAPRIGAISEVGVAVADVPAAVAALRRAHGLEPYQRTTDDFAPVGDEEGLLILVAEGRPWYPTQAVVAAPLPLTVEAAVPGRGGVHGLNPLAVLRASAADG